MSYYDMGRIEQLLNGGRELIGKELFITVKRDGENCSLYQNPNSDMIHIASHHKRIALDDIRTKVQSTKEYPKALEIFEENSNYVPYFEHMKTGRSPTRIEMPKKHNFLILIDIYDKTSERYLSYNYIHQVAHKYKLPIVKLLDVVCPQSLDELWEIRNKWLKWCVRHHREGFVIKDFYSKYQCFAKEKINLPKRPKIKVKDNRPQLPDMPHEKILSAVEQAMAEIIRSDIDPKDKSIAMPIVARYIATEAREHCYASPSGMFQYYIDWLREMDK